MKSKEQRAKYKIIYSPYLQYKHFNYILLSFLVDFKNLSSFSICNVNHL